MAMHPDPKDTPNQISACVRIRAPRGTPSVTRRSLRGLVHMLLIAMAIPFGCATPPETGGNGIPPAPLVLSKNTPFSKQLDRMARATHGILTITFYAHPMNEDTGEVVVSAGTGIAIAAGTHNYLVTAAHVLAPEETISHEFIGFTATFEKSETRAFLYPPGADLFGPMKQIAALLKGQGGGSQVSRMRYEHILSFTGVLLGGSADITAWDRRNGVHPDLVALHIPANTPVKAIPSASVDTAPWVVPGKEIALFGNPNAYGRHYREGVISRPDSLDHQQGNRRAASYHIDVIVAEGDSGAPVLSTSHDGQLKVYGILVASMPRQPRLGRVVSGKALKNLIETD